ncbi:MAG: MFS transporter [Candidatus Aerophobetes bacterium]|nr:MFS transporter [Candidatus Aerophobetes bacterium]
MQRWEKNLYTAWISQLIAIIGFSFVFPFIPFYIQELGITDVGQVARWTGILAAIPALTMAVFSPIWGFLADKYGRKLMVERAMFGGAIVIACMGLATNVYQLLALRIIQGALTGTVPASVALISTTTPRERLGFSLGFMQTAVFSGASIGPLIGGVTADFLGYRCSFYITGSLLFIAGLIVLFLVKEKFQPLLGEEVSEGKFWKNLWIVFSSRQLLAMIVILFCVRFARMIVYPIFPLFVQFLANTSFRIASITGVMLASAGITSALSSAIIGRVSDKTGYKNILIISTLGAGMFYFSQAFAGSIFQLFMLQIALGFFFGGIMPTANAIIGFSVSEEHRGKVYGITASATALGKATGPLAGGIIASTLNLRAIFIFSGVILMAVGIWVATVVRESKNG